MLACRGFPIMRVKMEQPSQTAPNAEQVPVPAIVKVENVTYRDKDTGDVIPYSKIEEDLGRLDNLCQLLKRWRAVYNEALAETNNDGQAAGRASNAIQGGSCSQLWDQLAKDKVVCSLYLKCPPTKDRQTMYANEQRVRAMIGRANLFLFSMIADIFTSRHEIGQVQETHVYVRFPYYLWPKVEELAAKLSVLKVGTHHFKAALCMEARKPLQKVRQVKQWQLECNGQALPELSQEEMAEMKDAAAGSFEEKFVNGWFIEDPACASTELKDCMKYLFDYEVQHIRDTITCKIFTLIKEEPKGNKFIQGWFQLCGIIINAAEKGNDFVLCFEGSKKQAWGEGLFHATNVGDNFLTLDPPFTLNMGESDVIKRDNPNGVEVIFCLEVPHKSRDWSDIRQSWSGLHAALEQQKESFESPKFGHAGEATDGQLQHQDCLPASRKVFKYNSM